jgi:hypothetical protein
MSKPWAKITVEYAGLSASDPIYWTITLRSDRRELNLLHREIEKRRALSCAKAWSRRLGNIPVVVQQGWVSR